MKNVKWHGESGIDASWNLPPAEDYCQYKEYILEHVSFVAIIKELKLKPMSCIAGKYTHKMTCPFKFHKNGRERTASFRFNDKKNTFVCYGCTEYGDVLKFLQLYYGGCEQYHLERLAKISGLVKDNKLQLPKNYIPLEPNTPAENNTDILFSISITLRQYLKELVDTKLYDKECEWVDKMFIKLDEYFLIIDNEDIKMAKDIYDNVEATIVKRKKHYKK